MTYTRVLYFSSGNLLHRAPRYPGFLGNARPAAFRRFKIPQNVIVHGFHKTNARPVFGFSQPTIGSRSQLAWGAIMGRKKTPKVPGFMRTIASSNLSALLTKHYKQTTLTARQRQLSKDAGVSFSTIQRIMQCDVGASLDNLESIAAVFDLSTYQLLIPGLNVNNPQVVKGASKDEQRIYAIWRKAQTAGRLPVIAQVPQEAT